MDFNKKPVALEVAQITELPGDKVVFLLNERFMNTVEENMKDKIVQSFFTLARDQLMNEAENPHSLEIVRKSPLVEHQYVIMAISFLLDDNNNFSLVTYFGGYSRNEITYREGLIHAAKVVSTIEARLG